MGLRYEAIPNFSDEFELLLCLLGIINYYDLFS